MNSIKILEWTDVFLKGHEIKIFLILIQPKIYLLVSREEVFNYSPHLH